MNTLGDGMYKHLAMFDLITKAVIINRVGSHVYEVTIEKTGDIFYKNNTNCTEGAGYTLMEGDADYAIHPMMEELFCNDEGNHGADDNGEYHWEILFFTADGFLSKTEGNPGEDFWRYCEFKKIVSYLEEFIPSGLGVEEMLPTPDDEEE